MGYTEGWAEYVGFRSLYYWDEIPDKMVEAIIYNEEIGYIMQAITDIGINYKGWTLDNMYEVWKGYYDIKDKADLKDAYEYFKAEPGVILSYPMGYLQIMDMRSTAKLVLGDAYSDKEFAKVFLEVGGAPLSMTKEYVLTWINSKANEK
jgi:uncharacterized protein (DUF885 family)